MGSEKEGVFGGPDPVLPTKLPISIDASGMLYSQNLRTDQGPQLVFSESPVLSGSLLGLAKKVEQTQNPEVDESQAKSSKLLPVLKGFFVMPTAGLNWGKLHDNNAVDIANACGTPIYAAAEGVVVPDASISDDGTDWNLGYGKFLLIEHPNGVKTRYAHLSQILVKPGDFVGKKEKIALMGNTGRVQGATGCHLHFEVLGARNPFVK